MMYAIVLPFHCVNTCFIQLADILGTLLNSCSVPFSPQPPSSLKEKTLAEMESISLQLQYKSSGVFASF